MGAGRLTPTPRRPQKTLREGARERWWAGQRSLSVSFTEILGPFASEEEEEEEEEEGMEEEEPCLGGDAFRLLLTLTFLIKLSLCALSLALCFIGKQGMNVGR